MPHQTSFMQIDRHNFCAQHPFSSTTTVYLVDIRDLDNLNLPSTVNVPCSRSTCVIITYVHVKEIRPRRPSKAQPTEGWSSQSWRASKMRWYPSLLLLAPGSSCWSSQCFRDQRGPSYICSDQGHRFRCFCQQSICAKRFLPWYVH